MFNIFFLLSNAPHALSLAHSYAFSEHIHPIKKLFLPYPLGSAMVTKFYIARSEVK
jgi:hypothetical protein